MKFGYALLLSAATFVGGYFVGNNRSFDDNYKVVHEEEKTMLYSSEFDKAHEITKTDNDFYLGGVEHNVDGANKLSLYNAQKYFEPKIDSLVNKMSELEEKIMK